MSNTAALHGRDATSEQLFHLDEDAFARAYIGRLDDRVVIPLGHVSETPGAARIIEHLLGFHHIGDAVIKQREHVAAVVDTESIARAQVLVDPYTHDDRKLPGL
jgi:hypothetical protein